MDSQTFASIIKAHITVGAITLSEDKEFLIFSGEAKEWAKANFKGSLIFLENEKNPKIPLWILYDSLKEREVTSIEAALSEAEKGGTLDRVLNKNLVQKLNDFVKPPAHVAQKESNKAFKQFLRTGEIYLDESKKVRASGNAAFWLKKRLKREVSFSSKDMEIIFERNELVDILGKQNASELLLELVVTKTNQRGASEGGFSLS